MNGSRPLVHCLAAHATDEQVADHPELAYVRGVRNCLADSLCVRTVLRRWDDGTHVDDYGNEGAKLYRITLLPEGFKANPAERLQQALEKQLGRPRRSRGETTADADSPAPGHPSSG